MAHMSQLAAMTPPTQSRKQKAPNRTIMRGWERWVIPNTTEVKRAKSSMAEK